MATLTSDQLSDLQADLSISSDQAVFTDAALNRLYTRAEENYELTVVLAIRQLLMGGAKLNDYTNGLATEKKSQVFDHLKSMLTYWESKTDETSQVKIFGSRVVPPRDRDKPFTGGRTTGRLQRRFGTDIDPDV